MSKLFNDRRSRKNKRNKLRTYRTFKTNYDYQDYLISAVTNADHSQALTKIRITNHSLEIENGRYRKPYQKIDQRMSYLQFGHRG
jgi:hypothetical protein